MDDEFLYGYRRTPPSAFEDDLYSRLERQKGLRRLWLEIRSSRAKTVLSIFIALVAIGLMGECAREVFSPGWTQVGEYQVLERSRQCKDFSMPLFPPGPQPDFVNPPPDPDNFLAIEEIRERLAYDLQIPTWAPDSFAHRFEYTDVVSMMDFSSLWLSEASTISFYASPTNDTLDPLSADVYRGTAEERAINGNPGILVRGGCGFGATTELEDSVVIERVWDDDISLLRWRADGVDYSLHSLGLGVVTAEDLVRMAESAR